MRRSWRALTASSVAPRWRVSWCVSGSSSATSRTVRLIVSGVRSSCEALATKRRCPSNDRSRRSSIASNVSARSLSSSSGPECAMRSWRLVSATRRAVAVMRCRGASTREDMTQPKPTASTPIPSSATTDHVRTVRRVWSRASWLLSWTTSRRSVSVPAVSEYVAVGVRSSTGLNGMASPETRAADVEASKVA
ncbi:hypothetical protein D3C74_349340 [compost metagenome]